MFAIKILNTYLYVPVLVEKSPISRGPLELTACFPWLHMSSGCGKQAMYPTIATFKAWSTLGTTDIRDIGGHEEFAVHRTTKPGDPLPMASCPDGIHFFS
jgi:hypothetical protein